MTARSRPITQEVPMRGPVPERSDQTVRRNKPEIPIEKVEAIGVVPIPDLDLDDPAFPTHQLCKDLYESLRQSAQSKFYEPSDWQHARLTLHFVNRLLWSNKPSAQMLASVNQMLTSLLMTEGDRRRVRMEVERNPEGGGKVVSLEDMFRQKLGG
ncbi:minor tail protein [Mycobacterium phage MyraDee]|uniref:Terminase small subunit n=1 Tax=Mycobacterium phage MyraDee TaxID=2024303 RepID=A0A222YZ83_9CAUD|nr:minor tail protein [Mycobacterium phage MyraDee]ASR77110.1 terminase small subunit [Mycobacterium phage MyraDee]